MSLTTSLTLTTWNINSVRLRLPLVQRFVAARQPDVLCLQETKVDDGKFPLKDLTALGYPHIAFNGQKGYHGVAILSRLPFDEVEKRDFCTKGDARHIAIRLAPETGALAGIRIHNLYIPAGGDLPDPDLNAKFQHKLAFLAEMQDWFASGYPGPQEQAILVGDLNVAPLEHDVWSHRQLLDVVSHTPVETQAMTALIRTGAWIDVMRRFVPDSEKLYTWWSYRAADWQVSNRGRRLDHIWASPALSDSIAGMTVDAEVRGWDRPSDHVPVTARFDVPARGLAAAD